eukprot:TRINITY_DN95204_c0_g1_i1.p2 TRINITY_DN95204_c0_g1~~TRINITY_DN95204_c0_g1_i1.p2  ORF type:complete len:229 (-),score=11.83 TRINITY_DN95204_c0_g1_i1:73-759(-)
MPFRLARDRFMDCRLERRIIITRPERRPQIRRILLAEAHIQRAGAGQPDPVAALAEIMGQRRDETDAAAGLLTTHVPGRTAGLIIDILQGPPLPQFTAHHGERPILVDPVLAADIAHRHNLDEGQIISLAASPADKLMQLIIIHPFQRDSVDLHLQSGGLRRRQAIHHLLDPAPAGYALELRRIQRIKGDVHAAHAAVHELGGMAGQLAAVCGKVTSIHGFRDRITQR